MSSSKSVHDSVKRTVLVTGGCGFLGEEVIRSFLSRGFLVRSFDKVSPQHRLDDVDYIIGDARDEDAVRSALRGISIVIHAVAAVPLRKSAIEFREVNLEATRLALRLSNEAGAERFVYISSSAVYGIPEHNPVEENDPRVPVEEYGRTKKEAEDFCSSFSLRNQIDVSVVRPRTILGPGRLGIFGLLFEWVSDGASVPVIGKGENVYQFVHVVDVAEAVAKISLLEGSYTFNIGGGKPDTMADALGALCAHANTEARTFRMPKILFSALSWAMSVLRISPLAPYHWLLFGETLYFSGRKVERELAWRPQFSSTEALIASYDSYVRTSRQETTGDFSPHRSVPRQRFLKVFQMISKLLFSGRH